MTGRRALEHTPGRPRAEVVGSRPLSHAHKLAAKEHKLAMREHKAVLRALKQARRRRKPGSTLLSLGAMLFAGALAIGMSVPASVFGNPAASAETVVADGQVADVGPLQTVEVGENIQGVSAARDAFTALSWAEMLVRKYGTRAYNYDATAGSIRWPFPTQVKISSGFGERVAPCQGCSSVHMGLDFQPPNDSPIYAIADGTVAVSQDDSYGYGNHVYIDHGNLLGDGNDIQSLYAHMQHGSVPLVAGQVIHAGDFIGLVGRTGTATGIHLHFELLVNGVQVDPFAWLQMNTN
jgi:murein DD-endopeptidase MepM/ murein hydrolase activator NlpD